jgi:cytochrome b561
VAGALTAATDPLILTCAIPATDPAQTARAHTAHMELIVLAAFVALLGYVAWKTPSAGR